MNKEELLKKIKRWYDGYSFSKSNERVYNPFSTLLFFDKEDFSNYWFETGTPSFLVNLIKNNHNEESKTISLIAVLILP